MAYALTIGSVLMDRPGLDFAWRHNTSLIRLRNQAHRGGNVRIPGIDGNVAQQLRVDELVCDLELIVQGKTDPDGDPYADRVEGKFANLAYLLANVATPTTATVAATLEIPGGGDLEADVQVRDWQVAADHGAVAVVTYDLVVPAGVWVPVGS